MLNGRNIKKKKKKIEGRPREKNKIKTIKQERE